MKSNSRDISLRISNLDKYLHELIHHADKYKHDPRHLLILQSQSSLAKASLTEFGLCPSSLNTLKSQAKTISPTKFRQIDDLRLNAQKSLHSLTNDLVDIPTTKIAVARERIRKQQLEILSLKEELFQLTNTIYSILDTAQRFLQQSKDQDLIRRGSRELQIIVSSAPKTKP